MSMTAITGLPGNGKTLYAIWQIQREAQREQRPVFYAGIRGLTLAGWKPIDPYDWMSAPARSIVVIDEAQDTHDAPGSGKDRGTLFGVRTRGEAPEWVKQLAKHRHLGIDIVILTQHPMLLDTMVRRLVDRHLHLVRRWGMQSSTVHEWREVRDDCHKRRTGSSKSVFKFPKEAFGWYASAEAHTMKVRVPWRVWGFGVTLLVLVALAWWIWGRLAAQVVPGLRSVHTVGQAQASPGPMAPAGAAGGQGLRVSGQAPGQPLGRYEWVSQWEPRVQGLGYTAPVYDELTRPQEVPYPAACVVMREECRCYTQQATRLDVPEPLCRSLVERGFFVAWRGQVHGDQAKPAALPASVPAVLPAAGPGLIVIGDSPRGPAAAQRVSVLER
jgi:hypothetical protein